MASHIRAEMSQALADFSWVVGECNPGYVGIMAKANQARATVSYPL